MFSDPGPDPTFKKKPDQDPQTCTKLFGVHVLPGPQGLNPQCAPEKKIYNLQFSKKMFCSVYFKVVLRVTTLCFDRKMNGLKRLLFDYKDDELFIK